MSVNFAEFDIAELKVLEASDAIGLPEMGASIVVNYAGENDDELGDTAPGMVSPDDTYCCSCCCCC